uniref:Uncharacterized protein n=1 Tax=Arundo donax TaxID=35708 RepID=A0A0A9B3K1_ARUDO
MISKFHVSFEALLRIEGAAHARVTENGSSWEKVSYPADQKRTCNLMNPWRFLID